MRCSLLACCHCAACMLAFQAFLHVYLSVCVLSHENVALLQFWLQVAPVALPTAAAMVGLTSEGARIWNLSLCVKGDFSLHFQIIFASGMIAPNLLLADCRESWRATPAQSEGKLTCPLARPFVGNTIRVPCPECPWALIDNSPGRVYSGYSGFLLIWAP